MRISTESYRISLGKISIRGEKVELRPNQIPSGQVLFVNSTRYNISMLHEMQLI